MIQIVMVNTETSKTTLITVTGLSGPVAKDLGMMLAAKLQSTRQM